MSELAADRGFDIEISQVVIRCGCGDPDRIHPGEPCPSPRAVEDNGVIGTWNSTEEEG